MALTPKVLEKLIKEQIRSVLKEQMGMIEKQQDDSLDQQIDDLLVDYESDSKIKKNEGFDFRSMTRRFLTSSARLTEADEEKADKPEEAKQKLTLDDIDIEEFAINVVRLIDNYDSLLEVKNTITRRAMNFLLENYDPTVVKQFEIVLEDQHDIVPGKTKSDLEDEKTSPPAAGSGGWTGGPT